MNKELKDNKELSEMNEKLTQKIKDYQTQINNYELGIKIMEDNFIKNEKVKLNKSQIIIIFII